MMINHGAEIDKLNRLNLDKLNFGCGPNPLPGWVNIDGGDGKVWTAPSAAEIVKLDAFDAVRRIPEGSARFIFSEQFFEHFDRPTAIQLLKEWYRILKPGGVVRIQTPDLEKEVLMYLDKLEGVSWEKDVKPRRIRQLGESKESYCKLEANENYTPAILLNNGMHLDGHLFLYDFETLAQSLRVAGFQSILKVEFGKSTHQELSGINLHDGGDSGRHWIPKVVLEVEAQKPF